MSRIFATLILAGLSGCAQTDALRSQALTQGSAVEDRILLDAETVQCRVVSVGAWIRRYGNNPALAAAWRTLCGTSISETPAKP